MRTAEDLALDSNGDAPAEGFDVRRLIREHIRQSDPRSDAGAIATRVAEEIPEEHLRTVVARWLPLQVANERFNMNAESTRGVVTSRRRPLT
jgi:hypothetical protein